MEKETTPCEAAKTQPNASTKPKRPPYKLEEAISALLEQGRKGMNQHDAGRIYGDTCLNTTISTLSNCKGIKFKRDREPIKTKTGVVKKYTRYWLLSKSDIKKARTLLKHLRAKRGAAKASKHLPIEG